MNRELDLIDQINQLRQQKEEVLKGYEFISDLERVKRYTGQWYMFCLFMLHFFKNAYDW